ncbi:MAG TPA: FliH/SctL family protein [Noviherbaspirillum sp.]
MASIIRNAKISSNKRKLARPGTDPAEQFELSDHAQAQTSSAQRSVTDTGEAGAAKLPAENQQQLQALFEKAKQSVLGQFKAEAEAARELGRQRGLQEGRQAAHDELRQTVASDLDRLRSIMGKLEASLNTGIEDLEDIALAITMEALCKMLGAAAVDQESVKAQIRHAAAQVQKQELLQVRLHPTDLAMLKDMCGLNLILPSGKNISWVADYSIELGGCILKTNHGRFDARFETQLSQLKQTLLEVRSQRKG